MNFYNPYYSMPILSNGTAKAGLFSRLLGGGGLTLGKILTGTERALNFANQAIPLIKQVKPMIGNAKTVFKVMNEFKRSEINHVQNTNNNTNINNTTNNNIKQENANQQTINVEEYNSPKFFI